MSTPHPAIAPVEEPVQPRDDALDWERIPSGRFELEFRPQTALTPQDHLRVLGLLILASALAVPIGFGLGTLLAPYVGTWQYIVTAAVLGVLLASVHELLRLRGGADVAQSLFDSLTVYFLIAPLFLLLAVSLTGSLRTPSGSFLYFLAIAMPAMIAAFDQLATHAVYWMTANVLVDHETQVSWRQDWAWRFVSQPNLSLSEEEANDPTLRSLYSAVVRARDSYSTGLLFLLAAVVVPCAFVLIINNGGVGTTIGLQIVVAVFFGVLATGVVRTSDYGLMSIQSWRMVLHWFFYAKDQRMPPWMFHSPSGEVHRRRLLMIMAVGLLSVATSNLVADSLWQSGFPAQSATANDNSSHSTSGSIVHPTALVAKVLHPAIPWYTIALVGLGGVIAPVVLFLAAGLLFIGPIILSYYRALEA